MTTVAPAASLATRLVSDSVNSCAHACYYAAEDAGCWYSGKTRCVRGGEAREA